MSDLARAHPALQRLMHWFDEAGIRFDTSLISFEPMPPIQAESCACLVRAVKHVSDGDLLGTIPKRACLSIRTTSIADLIATERLGGGLGLVFAVMHEVTLQADSFW